MSKQTSRSQEEVSRELAETRRVLGWVFDRTRRGLFSLKRSERDAALSDVNFATQEYASFLEPSKPDEPNRIWYGEQP